jgi:thymidine kinase
MFTLFQKKKMRQSTAVKILAAGKNVFLTGAPGSGKTHLLNRFIGYLREREVPTAITAPTGIAATHIGGMTLHSWSGLGIRDSVDEKILEKLLTKSYLKKRFETTKVLIIDEISMLSPGLFEAVNDILKNVRFSPEPFGGVQVVLTGDFFQLPPVVKTETKNGKILKRRKK